MILAFLAATAISLAGLGYLAATDRKRRRAFRLPPPAGRRGALGWAAVLAPGAIAAGGGGAGGVFLWLGAVSAAGWAVAAAPPGRTAGTLRATRTRLAAHPAARRVRRWTDELRRELRVRRPRRP